MTTGEYIKAAGGNIPAGVVLQQIAYWFLPSKTGQTKLRVHRNGRMWLAKTHKDLATECGIPERKVKDAVAALRDLKLIETERHRFGVLTQNFIWLDLARLGHPDGQPASNRSDVVGPSGWTAGVHPYTENTAESTTETTTVALRAEAAAEKDSTEACEGKTVNADEIMKKFKDQKDQPVGKIQNTVSGLCLLWKKRISLDGKFHHDLGGKERGQLKLFLAKAGPRAYEALDWVLQNWGTFAYEVKMAYGLSHAPDQAVPGFVLQYYDVALQLIAPKLVIKGPAPKPLIEGCGTCPKCGFGTLPNGYCGACKATYKKTGGVHMNGTPEVVKVTTAPASTPVPQPPKKDVAQVPMAQILADLAMFQKKAGGDGE